MKFHLKPDSTSPQDYKGMRPHRLNSHTEENNTPITLVHPTLGHDSTQSRGERYTPSHWHTQHWALS
jgi:hypothetical protein